MATEAEIAALRLLIAEPTADNYTDTALSDRLDAASPDQVAYDIWIEKAARFAQLVDISEGGSSRKQGDLYEQALSMAQVYADRVTTGSAPPGVAGRTRISRLVRP
jgi:hypothetical protein